MATSVARITEISARSTESFDDALRAGIHRANATLRGVSGVWVKDQKVDIVDGNIAWYVVHLAVTFVLDD